MLILRGQGSLHLYYFHHTDRSAPSTELGKRCPLFMLPTWSRPSVVSGTGAAGCSVGRMGRVAVYCTPQFRIRKHAASRNVRSESMRWE